MEAKNMEITQDMIDQSAQEEGEVLAQIPAVLQAQNQALHNRVVLLRALVNGQQRELEFVNEELAKLKKRRQPADRQPGKKTAATPRK